MDYIISGGLGFIGKNLVIKLRELKKEFQVLDRLNDFDVIKDPIFHAWCNTFVHLAAFTNVRESIEHPVKSIMENTEGTLSCLHYARESGAHFIFASSMGAAKSLSPYSASKLAGEAFCVAYRASYDTPTTILRLANVYGPHSKHKESVVAKFIKNCLDRENIKIYGDGLQTRDFIHVDDVVRTILHCSKAKLINVGSGKATSILKLAEMIRSLSAELTGYIPEIVWKDANNGEISTVKPKTNIRAKVDLETGLRSTFKWFMEHYHDKRVE